MDGPNLGIEARRSDLGLAVEKETEQEESVRRPLAGG